MLCSWARVCTFYKLNYCTQHVIFVLHALIQFTSKPTIKPMQWCTHFGNAITITHLILHPDKWVIVRSHIRNDRLLIWTGPVHIWNRKLQDSLLFVTLLQWLPSWYYAYFTKHELSTSCCVMYRFTISGGMYFELCYVQSLYHGVSMSCCVMYTVTISECKNLQLVSYTGTISGDKLLEPYLINSDYITMLCRDTRTLYQKVFFMLRYIHSYNSSR